MFITKLLHQIGHFFGDVYNVADKAWHHLSPELQNALIHASAIVATINENADKAPSFVIDLIQSKFPGFTVDKLKAVLAEVSKDMNIVEGVNDVELEKTIENLQAYLSTKQGKFWEAASSLLAQGIAIALAPAGTKFALIVSFIETAYRKFVKKA